MAIKDIMNREKDTKFDHKGLVSLSNTSISRFFNNDHVSFFIFKKTERLVAAVYLLTDLFEKDNPFRHKLRLGTTDLLLDSFRLAGGHDGRETLSSLKRRALEILVLLESAHFSGFVSPMNLSIFQNQYAPVLSLIEERENGIQSGKPVVEEDFFNDGVPPLPSTFSIGHSKGHNVLYGLDKRSSVPTPSSSKSRTEARGPRRNGLESPRMRAIMLLVKRHGEVSVKTVSAVVKDCSEKTIQRDLLALVASGVLKKTGERRWSRYSLTQ